MDRGGVLVDQRDRRILLKGEIGEPHPVHQVDLERDETERVSVRRGGGDRLVADHARPARAVHDVHRLLEIAFQHVGDLARDRVGAAAGGHGTISVIGRSGKAPRAFPEPSRLAAASAASAKFLAKFLTWRNIRKPSPFVFDAPGETPRRALLRCQPFGRRSADMSRGRKRRADYPQA